jgi:5-(carboxyamino)imidazole ribonucleotide synthase
VIVGILGGGQLGRMLALAGHPLGIGCVFLDPAADACASPLARSIRARWDDVDGLGELARQADVVTFEFENVPAASAELVATLTRLRPGARALAAGRDRLDEKRLFRRLGIATARFVAIDDAADLDRAGDELGFPYLVKSRTLGYDGKGQYRVDSAADVARIGAAIGSRPAIAEELVAFDRELSVIAARDEAGHVLVYPLSENRHRDGILRLSLSRPGDRADDAAQACIRSLASELDYVGVLALELFDRGGTLLANEFAPRVHNSGHWTIEGAQTSQFENHLRAVAGWPLGATAARGHAAMINLIGDAPRPPDVLRCGHARLHLYGKEPRPGRKIGHVTVTADSAGELAARLGELAFLLDPTDRPSLPV